MCLYLPSEHRDCTVKLAIGANVAVLGISVVPVLADAIMQGPLEDRRWPMMLFFGVHSMFLSWIFTGFNVATIYYQVTELRSRPQEQALSRLGLASQAAVFAMLAWSWVVRVEFPYGMFGGVSWQALSTWYQLVGWAAVDNAIFAFGQAVLFLMILRQPGLSSGAVSGEDGPLLHT